MSKLRPYGDTSYDVCPICDTDATEPAWRVPFTKLEEPISINGMTVQYAPMYGSVQVHEYSRCAACESISLNPYNARRKTAYASESNTGQRTKIKKASDKDHSSWKGYRARYDKYIHDHLSQKTRIVVDAACGGGQYVQLLQQDTRLSLDRLVALELSPIAVAHLTELGVDARQYDLDSKHPPEGVEPGSVDFVIFSEAFEHVEFPLRSMRTLTGLLRPGGRMFFSAQRLDDKLPLRPGENHAITERGLEMLMQRLQLTSVHQETLPGKWLVIGEKR